MENVKNVKILTLISSIIDIIIGLSLIVFGVVAVAQGINIPDNSSVIGTIGVGVAYAIIYALGIIALAVGAIFLGYGITFLILAIKQTSNISKKRKAFFIVSIIEYVIAGVTLIGIFFNSSMWYAFVGVSAVLIATATLKIIDSHKMKNEKMLEQPQA